MRPPAGGFFQLRQPRRPPGQTILTGADTAEIIGTGKVEGVKLKDGTLIPASLVVMAVGIRPSTQLARDAGLAVGRGIQVDDHMVTSDPAVPAVEIGRASCRERVCQYV